MASSYNQGGKGQKDGSGTSGRGFASMDPAQQREIASQGGKAAHASGNAHEFTSEEAREAGSKSHSGGGNSGGSGNGGAKASTKASTKSSGGSGSSGSSGSSGGSSGSGDSGSSGSSGSSGTRGGSSEQHTEAGRQSHKKS